ncbi:hypothetical protein [Streptomyces uncialis]|uniref:hypothetical protein n=1 Tax=Streptomyces uncialis TaxID=1048205 RepID=UPI00224F293D|nr:hypothetical protein [Streptomyces uncialis]MCX4661503.1 hypothetical protein [Streptomyces uncialis]
MVEGLPPDGALARAAAGHHWRQADYHAADTVDLLGRLLTLTANAHRAAKTRAAKDPPPVWRPGDPTPTKKARKARRAARRARAAYQDIVAIATPEHAHQ